MLRNQSNTTTLLVEVDGIDLAGKSVQAGGERYPYDYLVIATGATHSYFGHGEWSAFAPGLKTMDDAIAIRHRILLSFEKAELAADAAERERLLTFVIVGGGPTGVELAGAIAEIAMHSLRREFRRIAPASARILLLEAGATILPVYPQGLRAYATSTLTRKGVSVRTGTMVTGCDAGGVATSAGRIEAGTVIWAAGVAASPAAGWLGAEHDRSGRVRVNADLTVPGHTEVFVIGDTAASAGDPVPGIAPAAKQMGKHAAKAILSRLSGGASSAPFHYRHYGDFATIGRNAAVARFGKFSLTGFPGWVLWSSAHIYFLIGARNRFLVAFNWLWDYVTFQRGARLITRDD